MTQLYDVECVFNQLVDCRVYVPNVISALILK